MERSTTLRWSISGRTHPMTPKNQSVHHVNLNIAFRRLFLNTSHRETLPKQELRLTTYTPKSRIGHIPRFFPFSFLASNACSNMESLGFSETYGSIGRGPTKVTIRNYTTNHKQLSRLKRGISKKDQPSSRPTEAPNTPEIGARYPIDTPRRVT